MTDLNRRTFLASAGGALAAAWIAADAAKLLAAGEYAARAGHDTRPTFKFLTSADAADIDAATSQIVPTDETPGAHEARVVHFTDQSLATWAKDQRGAFT